jgi:hypothetical protein
VIETAILTIRGERFLYTAAHMLGQQPHGDGKANPTPGGSFETLPLCRETERGGGGVPTDLTSASLFVPLHSIASSR